MHVHLDFGTGPNSMAKATEVDTTSSRNQDDAASKESKPKVSHLDEASEPTQATPTSKEPEKKKRKRENGNTNTESWDPAHCGQLIKLSNDDTTMETFIVNPEDWSCVMASTSVETFSVQFNTLGQRDNGDIWIGYCKQDGFVPNGSTRGRFCQILPPGRESVPGDETSHAFASGDTLTVVHKRANGTIVFLKNDQDIGVEYENVSDEDRFPAVVTNRDGVSISFV
ncbi:hypothetical protein LEN26_014140 [Aphanomyces euteiches]|nr:hypothetical protein LEN26_014140 [Aphanomyces euteiches]KAH9127631.1 hypothetical protein AeMF1_002085 [Aphanomyces euteiches]KAH9188778.1 hypothetical protein AeNC1_009241 [Aphanomyces euteiches]